MQKTRLFPGLALLAFSVALCSTPALAGFDLDFGAAIRVGDKSELYLAISSRYFDQDRKVVETYAVRYADPDDVAVCLFISRRSGRPVEYIHSLRRQGLSWWDVSLRVGLPMDVWFVEVERAPGPPYGKAYGHWKHHKRDRRHAVMLSDVDLRNLVAVRMIHEYYGVPVGSAMDCRSSGRNLRDLMAEEYGRRHVRAGPGSTSASAHGPGKGKGKSKGKGRGKGD